MGKDFKTVAQLVELLNERNVSTDEDSTTAIERESYYAIVNGYKDPFLDRMAMQSHPGDVYLEGTQFRWLHDLFMFDRDLRLATFKYLTRAEAVFRTAVVYAFCEKHPEQAAYTDFSNYCAPDEILVQAKFKGSKGKLYHDNRNKLLKTLTSKQDPSQCKLSDPVRHYREKHGFVPLWVLSKDLTFGNMVHFFQLMKPADRESVCSIVARIAGVKPGKSRTLSPRKLLKAGNTLVDFRNKCAHDDRLYRPSERGGENYESMLTRLSVLLPEKEVADLVEEVEGLFEEYSDRLHGTTAEELLGKCRRASVRTREGL